jgi:hypothetical protein
MGENTEDYDITLLSAEEAMRQIVKGYVITPRLLKEESRSRQTTSVISRTFSRNAKPASYQRIWAWNMQSTWNVGNNPVNLLSRNLERCRFGGVQHQSTVFLRLPEPMLLAKSRLR